MSINPYVPYSALSSLPTPIWSGVNGLPVLPFLPGQDIVLGKAPLWSTNVARMASGREVRTEWWSYPLWQFELAWGVIRHRPTQDELATMWEFFNVMQGQYAPFLFVDPTDNQVLVGAPAGSINTVTGGTTGDGTTTTFQLTRSINSFVEPVYDVYSPTILDNGLAAGTHTLGPNGVVTFNTAPLSGHTITWYGYFYFGCRFDQDDFPIAQQYLYLWTGKSLKFTSLRA